MEQILLPVNRHYVGAKVCSTLSQAPEFYSGAAKTSHPSRYSEVNDSINVDTQVWHSQYGTCGLESLPKRTAFLREHVAIIRGFVTLTYEMELLIRAALTVRDRRIATETAEVIHFEYNYARP